MDARPASLPLRLEGVGYAVGARRLLSGVDLEVQAGGRTLILGPNGAGKSLLLRLAHGLLAPTEGRVIWQGAALGRPGPPRHAMVFQRPVMLRRSAQANLTHALAAAGLPRAMRRTLAERALERFGLAALADRPARVLSGGEQQRLAIARAAALEPEVLFLDEPAAALDPAATRAIEEMLRTLGREGVTVVMSTHDLAQARRLADRVVFMDRGRVRESGPAERFFDRPETAEARAFLAGELIW